MTAPTTTSTNAIAPPMPPSKALVLLELATLVSISTAAAVTDVPANDTHKVVGNEEGVVNPYVCL
jgi:hypothetical protein